MSQHVVSSNLFVHVAHADIQIAAIGVAFIGVEIAASSSPLRMAGCLCVDGWGEEVAENDIMDGHQDPTDALNPFEDVDDSLAIQQTGFRLRVVHSGEDHH